MAETTQDLKRPAPPYIAFQTLKTLVGNMKSDGVPGRIDKTMLRNFSGAVGSQLMTALKFMSLTNVDGEPTDDLKALVEAFGTEAWHEVLAKTIKGAFAPIFKLNLETATPGQFTEQFGKAFDGEGDTQRKAITFFVNGVREARIPISAYILKNKKPRSGTPGKKRAPKANAAPQRQQENGDEAARLAAEAALAASRATAKPSAMLLDLLDKQMQQAEKDAIWLLIQYFKDKGQ